MAHITRETLDNCFILIDGAIPNSDSLKEQYPHRRPMIRLDTGRFPPCEEERKAYLLTAHAMDIYARMAHGRVAEGVGSIAIPIEGDNIISDSCLIISDNIERMSPKDTRKIYETVSTYLSSNAHRNIRLRRFPQRS